MLGKANEIKTTGALQGIEGVDNFLLNKGDRIICNILISPGDIDYFYIIYKEYVEPVQDLLPFE